MAEYVGAEIVTPGSLSLPTLIEVFIARCTMDIYHIVIYCSALQYSALGHSSLGGGGGVISPLCRVRGP